MSYAHCKALAAPVFMNLFSISGKQKDPPVSARNSRSRSRLSNRRLLTT